MKHSKLADLHPSSRRPVWQLIALISTIGLVVAVTAVAVTARLYKTSLQTRAETIANALDTSRIERLRDTPPGLASDDYDYFRAKLAAIKDANTDARFVYLMGRNAQGEVYFIADSEPADSRYYSPRGDKYAEASPALKAMFDNHQNLVEGPSRDSYGNWLSALSPIINDRDYRLVGVVGIDVPARSYQLLLSLAGGVPLVLALLTVAIVTANAQARRRRHESARFRAEMVSIASHELRTPLTGLRWSQEALLGHKLGATTRQSIQGMYDSTLRLQESIEDILQLANLDSGYAHRLFKSPTDLKTLIDGVIAMQHLAAQKRGISIAYAKGWPQHLIVDCDAQRIKRVFNNIISNAIKYSRPRSTVLISYHPGDVDTCTISVQDHGIGIPQAELVKVTGGFYRATNAVASNINGDGLGMYVSRSIVAQHGGDLHLESTEGQGTTAYVELPGRQL